MQIGQLDGKLSELDAEREELKRYQAADRQRRSLEFTIWDAELADVRAKLEQASVPCMLRAMGGGMAVRGQGLRLGCMGGKAAGARAASGGRVRGMLGAACRAWLEQPSLRCPLPLSLLAH